MSYEKITNQIKKLRLSNFDSASLNADKDRAEIKKIKIMSLQIYKIFG